MMMGGIEAPMTLELVRPNKIRTEIEFQAMKLVTAFDGATGWVISPFGGKTEPEKMGEAQLKMLLDQADFDGPLVDYKKKGHAVEFRGEDEIEGTPTYKLKLTKKSGTVEYYHLDMEHYIIVARTAKMEFQGGEIETEEHFGDYKLVGGRLFAHAVESKRGAMGGGALTFEKIEVNPTISDDRFVMPKAEPEAKKDEPSKPKDKSKDND
jgi:outer membrane lipoprotein-sorting protein